MENWSLLLLRCHPFPGYISSGRVVYGPADKHPERIFPAFVAMFIEEGILYFTEGEHAHILKPGQWFVQTPGIRHYGHQAGGVRTVFHFVHFLPEGEWRIEAGGSRRESSSIRAKRLDGGDGLRLPRFEFGLPMQGDIRDSGWYALLDRLHREGLSGTSPIGKQAAFLELFERMIRFDRLSAAEAPIRKVIHYIENHFAEPLTVAELARRFHFSPDYLARQIKRAAGLTPSALIARYRIHHAKHLLVHTNGSVQDIGRDSGYGDSAVFSRVFKKHAGQSPARYRREHWGKSDKLPSRP